MTEAKKIYTESSLTNFLVTVVLVIGVMTFALYQFGIFPFNTWFNDDNDSAKVEVNQHSSLPLQSL